MRTRPRHRPCLQWENVVLAKNHCLDIYTAYDSPDVDMNVIDGPVLVNKQKHLMNLKQMYSNHI